LAGQNTIAGPQELYRADVARGVIVEDSSQLQAIAALESRFWLLVELWQQAPGLFAKLADLLGIRRQGRQLNGLYFWGGVGRGKTYLMDLFFHALPGKRKLRMHFHRFMLMVHRRMQDERGRSDPLRHVASSLAREVDVICFDEFFVSDIGDAMILANLLDALFEAGVMLVTTSNIEPDRLYERGLQRQLFLPAIALLKRHTEVMNIDGSIDYRLRSLDKAPVYHYPRGVESERAMRSLFDDLTRGLHVESPKQLDVEGRQLQALRWAEGIVWFGFPMLCRGARGAADYVELARQFHTVFLADIPSLDESRDDETRRFINLVDEFYDHGVKLVVSAPCPLENLYQGKELRAIFARTTSRLLEMQTREYLAGEHHPD
jgi:cell division protein ZapE